MARQTSVTDSAKLIYRMTLTGVILLLLALGLAAVGGPFRLLGVLIGVAGVAVIGVPILRQRHSLKQLATARSLRHGMNAVVLTIAVIAIVIFANMLASQKHIRWDVTSTRANSLSQQTLTVLKNLDQPLQVYAFYQRDNYGIAVENLLKEYALRSDRFRYEIVDPTKNPALAQRFDVDMQNMMVFTYGSQTRKVYSWDVFSQSQSTGQEEFVGEQAITRAIVDLTEGKAGKVCFMTAHGERNLNMEYRLIRSFVEGEGYDVEELNIALEAGVPKDASAIVIAGPQRDYSSPEIEALQSYALAGGRIMIFLDPPGRAEKLTELEKWLAGWGVIAHQDLVVDPSSSFMKDALSPVPQWEYHKTTRDLMAERVAVVIPRARSLEAGKAPEGYELVRLMKTSDSSWGEVNLTGEQPSKDAKDYEGPLALGYAIEPRELMEGEESPIEGPAARIIVMGSSSWVTPDVLGVLGNHDYFLNTINWLAGREQMLTIRPKSADYRPVLLSAAGATAILYLTVVFIPLVALLLGVGVWWRRRRL